MLGHAAIAEAAISDVGGVLLLATAEMNALATSSSIGSGTLVGVSSLSGNFTKTTAGILITGGVNAEVRSSFTGSQLKVFDALMNGFKKSHISREYGWEIRIVNKYVKQVREKVAYLLEREDLLLC